MTWLIYSFLNIRLIIAVNTLLGGVYYFVSNIVLDRHPGIYPWSVQIAGFLAFSYLSIRVVEEGESSLQRSLGYFGGYSMTFILILPLSCHLFGFNQVLGMPCDG